MTIPFTLKPVGLNDKLIGRSEFIQQLLYYIQSDISFSILGGRRCGKTTILQRLCREQDQEGMENTVIVYWDAQAPSNNIINDILKRIAREESEEIKQKIEFLQKKFTNPFEQLEALLYWFRDTEPKKKLVVIMDEFDALEDISKAKKNTEIDYSTFFNLRSLHTHFSENLVFILASPKHIDDLSIANEKGSGFLNMFLEVYLPLLEIKENTFYEKYLTTEELEDFIKRVGGLENLNTIYNWAGTNPYLLQKIGLEYYPITKNKTLSASISKVQSSVVKEAKRWLEKKYFTIENLVEILKFDKAIDYDSDNKNYLQAYCLINTLNKSNGIVISLMINQILAQESNKLSERFDSDSKFKNRLIRAYKRFDVQKSSIFSPYFDDLLILGWIELIEGGFAKLLNPELLNFEENVNN